MGFRRGGRFYNLRDRANGRGTNRNGQSYTAIKKATTDSKKTAADLIDAASKEIVESITGSNGGYVVQRPAKNPQETLYMDTPDVTTAKNVMRLNKDGIAFSTNGVGGPYSGALAINGKWFSQFIATWELTANIIKAGILQDAVGKNSINLDTGEVNLDCKSLKIQGKTTEEIAAGKASEAETAAKKAAADELNAYKEAVTKDLADMQGQIDGQIETWFFDDEPSPTTPPASDWTTDELKENHAGDLYYSGKGYAYRWTHSGGAWTWLQIKDTDITAALQNAKRAQETANSKRRTFLVQPTPPYDIGDLWDGALKALVCIMAVDYITGVVCVLIWHKSPKSADGTFESKASIKGLFRKGAILLVVLVAYKVDLLAGTAGVTRTAVILFFCANDGMSIVENLGIMGVPMPPALKDAFAVLRQKSGDEESAADETE